MDWKRGKLKGESENVNSIPEKVVDKMKISLYSDTLVQKYHGLQVIRKTSKDF